MSRRGADSERIVCRRQIYCSAIVIPDNHFPVVGWETGLGPRVLLTDTELTGIEKALLQLCSVEPLKRHEVLVFDETSTHLELENGELEEYFCG